MNNEIHTGKIISEEDELNIVRLYTTEKYTLRRIGRIIGIDHHRVKRIIEKHGVSLSNGDRVQAKKRGYKRKPFSEEHRRKIGLATRNRKLPPRPKATPEMICRNMVGHLHRDIPLDFFLSFSDVNKLKCLTSIANRDRVSEHFNDEQYKNFISHFYYDDVFDRVYQNWQNEQQRQYAKPSLDHIIPLSKGGTWELSNLQIIPWCVNRAKYNYLPNEWEYIKDKYFCKEGDNSV